MRTPCFSKLLDQGTLLLEVHPVEQLLLGNTLWEIMHTAKFSEQKSDVLGSVFQGDAPGICLLGGIETGE